MVSSKVVTHTLKASFDSGRTTETPQRLVKALLRSTAEQLWEKSKAIDKRRSENGREGGVWLSFRRMSEIHIDPFMIYDHLRSLQPVFGYLCDERFCSQNEQTYPFDERSAIENTSRHYYSKSLKPAKCYWNLLKTAMKGGWSFSLDTLSTDWRWQLWFKRAA